MYKDILLFTPKPVKLFPQQPYLTTKDLDFQLPEVSVNVTLNSECIFISKCIPQLFSLPSCVGYCVAGWPGPSLSAADCSGLADAVSSQTFARSC